MNVNLIFTVTPEYLAFQLLNAHYVANSVCVLFSVGQVVGAYLLKTAAGNEVDESEPNSKVAKRWAETL